MPREARLFTSSAGSVVRGYFKFRANIPSRWIKNARNSRKRIEPEIAKVSSDSQDLALHVVMSDITLVTYLRLPLKSPLEQSDLKAEK